MRINSWILGLVVVVLIFGGITVSGATGSWLTTGARTPVTFKDGEFAGQSNPADIRGSYTFGDISEAFEIPVQDLGRAFGLKEDADIAGFQCKELESLYLDSSSGNSVGVNSVRLFVAFYKGLPIATSDGDYLLPEAATILKEKATLTAEQVFFLETHILNLKSIAVPETSSPVSPTSSGLDHTTVAGTITGKTTFQELLDWGLSSEEMEKAIQSKIPSRSMAVRDYAAQNEISFSELKAELQRLLDSLRK